MLEKYFKLGEIKPGLKRVKELLRRMDNPQDKIKIVHLSGTNGKGSVSAFLNNILIEGGYKVGMFSSPSILSFNHMFLINNKEISDEKLLDIIRKIKKHVSEMEDENLDIPTEYEIIAAIMYEYFYREAVDFAVVEVAMGGENDCTNVMKDSILSLMTPISLDHTNFLGSTVVEIAREKSGIIKNNSSFITEKQDEKVKELLKDVCKEKNTSYKEVSFTGDIKYNDHMLLTINNIEFESNLIGKHQADNIVLTYEAVKDLKERGYIKISLKQIQEGIKNTYLPGRFERVSNFILDGAHNKASFHALKNNLEVLHLNDLTAVIGVLKDKDLDFSIFKPFIKKIIVTEPLNDRKLSADLLQEKLLKDFDEVKVERDIKQIVDNLKDKETILSFGSFYMIGEIRKHLLS